MTATRDDLVHAIQASRHDGRALAHAAAALDTFDKLAAAHAAASRELDLGAEIVASRLQPVPAHELHTPATDWLAHFEPPAQDGYRTKMIAEASTWYGGLDSAVREDGEELYVQARGRARVLASAYGSKFQAAAQEFLQMVGYLSQSHGASGLPQIDQLIDPSNAPSPTPYPTEVFDNFAPEQDEFNGVETPDHGSQISSDGAPLVQQTQQQNSSGSGFGSGPERPDQHSTSMDTSDSYAEVPLGTPGQIPTTPAATDRQVGSAPNPVAGQNQDAGAEQRRVASVEGYSAPDAFGYRWVMTTEVMHPYHEKCASAHWPDEDCGDRAHTGSVAIGYQMDLDKARLMARAEQVGVREGLRAVQANATLGRLVTAHNRFARAWGDSDRSAEDTAVLHGFCAVVRPVMSEMMGRETDQGATQKVAGYLSKMAHEHEPGSRLDFPRAAEAAFSKGAPFAGYTDFDSCVQANQDKDDPSAYCGEIKHRTEDKSKKTAGVPSPACPNCHSRDVRLTRQGGQNVVTCSACGNSQPYAQTSDIMEHDAASSLTQVQQTTDPNNQPTPQDDDLPEGVAFPLNEAWTQQWQTGPAGAAPKGKSAEAARMNGLPTGAASLFGHLDALDGRDPHHKSNYPYSTKAHGAYLRSWNGTHAAMTAINDKAPLTSAGYGEMTGRPDLYPHWQSAFEQAQRAMSTNQGHSNARESARKVEAESGSGVHPDTNRCSDCGHLPGCDCPHHCDNDPVEHHASRKVHADAWSQPHPSTDDLQVPYSQPSTNTPMTQGNGDYAAGHAAGQADRAAGERPAFADNSSGVSAYVKGYAEAYGAAAAPQGAQDVPYSMGGDSGQDLNAGEAQRAFQVAHASRVSDSFVPPELHSDPDFAKGYRFTQVWASGVPLVKRGSAALEAGLYAGITDQPAKQAPWLVAHALHAQAHPDLAQRVALHRSFSIKAENGMVRTGQLRPGQQGLRVRGAYLVRQAADDAEPTVSELQDAQRAGMLRPDERLSEISKDRARQLVRKLRSQRTAGTSTDLITDGPGTSPDPMGATPLNGPGTPPPMAGRDEASAPGGAPPYQGAPPLPGGPVVPDDVMGDSQQQPQPSGPFTNTFSGDHPGNATLAPVAPNSAAQPGYSNKDAYSGNPHGGDRVASRRAFRERVQAGLAAMRTEGTSA